MPSTPGTPASNPRYHLPLVVLVAGLSAVLAWWGWPPTIAESDPPAATRSNPPAVAAITGPGEVPWTMETRLAELKERSLKDDPHLGRGSLERGRKLLQALPTSATPRERFGLTWAVAHHHLRLGENRQATGQFDAAMALLPEIRGRLTGKQLDEIFFQVAVAWLRRGETENCVECHTPDSCLLPIRGGGVYEHPESARKAIAVLGRLLARNPDHSAARWLLNIAWMAVGEYPEKVPEAWRIAPSVFESQTAFPRFLNISADLGLNAVNLSGGAVAEDFDGDGWIDIATSTWDAAGPLRLYRNNGDGTFAERTREAGLEKITGGLNLVHADYDNDGDVDLLVLRGGWLEQAGRQHPNSLLQNDGTGRFRDVTLEVGLAGPGLDFPTQTAAWADYDNDGDLDLFVGNEGYPGQLFRNDAGRFRDVALTAGVSVTGIVKGVAWGDYDNDDDPDLYVSVRGGANRLFRNDGGVFTDVAEALGVAGPQRSFPTWFWDFNNDGFLDLYVASYREGLEDVAADFLGRPHNAPYDCLYQGDGEGGFREVAGELGLTRVTQPMGCNFGDLDNDGWPDFYLGTGYPEFAGIMPNLMYRNRQGTGFDDVTFAAGFGHLQKGHGVAFADFDHDGDLDVFQQIGGWYPGDAFANALFENPGFSRHWLAVRVEGRRSNRQGIGVRLKVEFTDGQTKRVVHQRIGSGGSFGGNPFRAHIGLGRATRVDLLEVHWPRSGRTVRFTDLEVDRLFRLVEYSGELVEQKLTPVTFQRRAAGRDRRTGN